MLVTALKGLKVVDVACGSGDAQTLAVTENGVKGSVCTSNQWFCYPLNSGSYSFLQVRCGPGGMEIMVNWAEEAAMVVRPPNLWRNCRTWT